MLDIGDDEVVYEDEELVHGGVGGRGATPLQEPAGQEDKKRGGEDAGQEAEERDGDQALGQDGREGREAGRVWRFIHDEGNDNGDGDGDGGGDEASTQWPPEEEAWPSAEGRGYGERRMQGLLYTTVWRAATLAEEGARPDSSWLALATAADDEPAWYGHGMAWQGMAWQGMAWHAQQLQPLLHPPRHTRRATCGTINRVGGAGAALGPGCARLVTIALAVAALHVGRWWRPQHGGGGARRVESGESRSEQSRAEQCRAVQGRATSRRRADDKQATSSSSSSAASRETGRQRAACSAAARGRRGADGVAGNQRAASRRPATCCGAVRCGAVRCRTVVLADGALRSRAHDGRRALAGPSPGPL